MDDMQNCEFITHENGDMFVVFSDTDAAWDLYNKLRNSINCRMRCYNNYEDAIEFI